MPDALTPVEDHLVATDLIDAPGAVLYSSVETVRPGPVYLLGLNPGGSEGATLRDSLAASRRGHNAYLDEQWAPGGYVQPVGQSTLQRRVQQLCDAMGLKTRNVPASNLAFTRSTRLGTHLGYEDAIQRCAPAHLQLLEAIRPSFVMTFGSLDHFRRVVVTEAVERRSAEHGSWQAFRGRARWGDHDFAFGNVPHMSLWASDKRPAVIDWAIAAIRA